MEQQNRKILFIVIDQLRADCLNGALAAHVDMPNLQAFQNDSVSFLNHFTVTNPCGPARASLLTGQYAMNHGAVRNGTPLVRGTPNLATELRKGGYDPLLFGYTDTAMDPTDKHPNDPSLGVEEMVMEGFNERVEMRYNESLPWQAYLKTKGYDLPPFSAFYDPVAKGRQARPDDPAFYRAEDSDTAFLTDRFLEEMAMRVDQNWCAHLTYIRPHSPLVAPEPYNKMYDPADLPMPIAAGQAHLFSLGSSELQPIRNMVRGCGVIDESDTQLLRAIYLGLATEVDHHIGRVLKFLKETGQYDDTLIVITADHGEMLGDHGLWAKQHLFDTSYRISLLIRDPDLPDAHGTNVSALTESIDVMPTILNWAGVPLPRSLNGHGLQPFLHGETPPDWREFVHMELNYANGDKAALAKAGITPMQANLAILRNDRLKLVHFNGSLEPLLFDLENDPHEQVNLAQDPAHQADMLTMTRALLSHRMAHLDQSMSELD